MYSEESFAIVIADDHKTRWAVRAGVQGVQGVQYTLYERFSLADGWLE